MESLGDGLAKEINRNILLRDQFIKIGAMGMIGASLILLDIQDGLKAFGTGDCAAMIKAYEKLKANKE